MSSEKWKILIFRSGAAFTWGKVFDHHVFPWHDKFRQCEIGTRDYHPPFPKPFEDLDGFRIKTTLSEHIPPSIVKSPR